MKKTTIIILLIIVATITKAQNYYLAGDSCFQAGDYQKSIMYFEKFLSQLEIQNQGRSFDYAKILVLESDSYLALSDLENSLKVCLKADSIMRECKQEKSDFAFKCYMNLAEAYGKKSDDENVIKYFLMSLPLIENVAGKDSQAEAQITQNLGYLYYNKENYPKAFEYLTQASRLLEKLYGENSEEYIQCVYDISQVCYGNSDIKKTMEYTEKYVLLAKNNNQKDSPKYVQALRNLGVGYFNEANYQKSLEYLVLATQEYQKTYGSYNDDYAKCVFDIAQIYFKIGDLNTATEYFKQYRYQCGMIYGENSLETATADAYLSSVYCSLTDFSNAIEHGKKAENYFENNGKKNSEYYYLSVSSLSSAYSQLKMDKEAFEYDNKMMKFFDNNSNTATPQYAAHLKSLGIKYANVANFEKSLECLKQASEIYLGLYGQTDEKYINTLLDISHTYLLSDDLQNAKSSVIKAYKYSKIVDSLNYVSANVLTELAEICLRLKNYNEVINYSEKALPILETTTGKNTVKYARTLITEGNALKNLSETDKALDYYNQAYTYALNTNCGKLFLANIQNEIASVYYQKLDFENAFRYFYDAYTVYTGELKSKFSFMTIKEKEKYWDFYSIVFDNLLTIALAIQNENAIKESYNSLLISKGLLLSSELQLTDIILNSGDSKLKNMFAKLKDLRQKLSSTDITNNKRYSDSLINLAQDYETQIVKASKQYGDIINYIKVDYQQVKNALEENDVAIEFFFTAKNFGALVLKKDFSEPKLEILTDSYYTDPYKNTEIYVNIWKPLEKYFSQDGNIYFSPSGKLHTLALEYAPIDNKTIISDKYHIFRISSTRNLALKKEQLPINSAVLYGGVFYDTKPETMQQESEKYSFDDVTRNVKKNRNTKMFQGGINAEYLKGTLTEVNEIKNFLDSSNIKTDFYIESAANEESFKNLSGKELGIIHIATHGFYLKSDDNSEDNALTYSGLLLSGCNNSEMPESVDDGILTAKEISYLDFRKTDLVVLSACETGLGKVSSEGVFGLQRGFKKTGVNTIVMSLWPVNDYATQLLMTNFYKNLSLGMSKHDAFYRSQKLLREKPGVTPQHWAAFIMLDGI